MRIALSSPPLANQRPSGLTAKICTGPSCDSGRPIGWPVTASHTFAVESLEPVMMRKPSAVTAIALIAAGCRSGIASVGVPFATSQMIAVPSAEAVAMRSPFGKNATWFTAPACFSGNVSGWPVTKSNARAIWSLLVAANRLPARSIASDVMRSANVAENSSLPVWLSQPRTRPAMQPVNNVRLFGANSTRVSVAPFGNTNCNRPVFASQMRVVPSAPAVAARLPSGASALAAIRPPCSSGGLTALPSFASQTRPMPSSLIASTRRPVPS